MGKVVQGASPPSAKCSIGLVGLHGDSRPDKGRVSAAKVDRIIGVERGERLARRLDQAWRRRVEDVEIDARNKADSGQVLDADRQL